MTSSIPSPIHPSTQPLIIQSFSSVCAERNMSPQRSKAHIFPLKFRNTSFCREESTKKLRKKRGSDRLGRQREQTRSIEFLLVIGVNLMVPITHERRGVKKKTERQVIKPVLTNISPIFFFFFPFCKSKEQNTLLNQSFKFNRYRKSSFFFTYYRQELFYPKISETIVLRSKKFSCTEYMYIRRSLRII